MTTESKSYFRRAKKGEKSNIICYESNPVKKTFKAIDLDTGVLIYGYWNKEEEEDDNSKK